ncbi:MAG: response regulator [Bacillota bacterium]|nr:response regulator [Bacillota bacterium]
MEEQQELLEDQSEELTGNNEKLKELLQKSQLQAEKLQTQQEELRRANSELKEQAKVLRLSEEKLQVQQEELRVSNEELEDKARILEEQKKEIANKAKELEIANKYKSEFLANMSHELRTPLNSIIVLSQILADKTDNSPLTEKQLEFARTIHSSGKELLELINDVLDLSKVESGKLDIVFETVRLRDVLESLDKQFRQIAVNKGLEFYTYIEEIVPEIIITDGYRLQQILKNLLSNAFKFTEKGKVEINIALTETENNTALNILTNRMIKISVSDTGIGIPEDKHKVIFEAFQQVNGSISRKYGGTGLGLSISSQLINKLGGKITINSREDKGSIFTVFILEKPISDNNMNSTNNSQANKKFDLEKEYEELGKRPQDSKKNMIAANKNFIKPDINKINVENKQKKSMLNGRKILVVDDDMRNVFAISSLLEENGVKLVISRNGREAIEKLKQNADTDLVLMDVMMPEMDGYTAMKEIRREEIYKKLPIIALTAKGMIEDKSKCIEAGANDYLTKPVDVNKLISLLKVWLYK